MLIKKAKKTNNYLVFNFLLAFFLFLTSNTVYWNNAFFHNKLLFLFLICCLISVAYSVRYIFLEKIDLRNYSLFLIFYLVFSSILVFKNAYYSTISVSTFLLYWFFPLVIITWIYYQCITGRKNDLLISFKNITVFFASMSLVAYFLVTIFHISPNSYLEISWGQQRQVSGYYGFLFNTQNTINFLGLNLLRNSGVFTEAPMHSFVLTLSLLIDLFVENDNEKTKKKFWEVIILLVTIVTTTSTTGLFITIVAFYFYFYKQMSQYLRLFSWVVVPVILIILIKLVIVKYENNYGSVSVRLDDIKAGYLAWLDHPFWGNGWTNVQAIQQYMMGSRLYWNGDTGISSGLFASLALGGILQTSVLFLIPYVLYGAKNKKIAFPVLIFLLLINAITNGTFIMITISMYMYISSISVPEKIGNRV